MNPVDPLTFLRVRANLLDPVRVVVVRLRLPRLEGTIGVNVPGFTVIVESFETERFILERVEEVPEGPR